jgi:hypothetical protein
MAPEAGEATTRRRFGLRITTIVSVFSSVNETIFAASHFVTGSSPIPEVPAK